MKKEIDIEKLWYAPFCNNSEIERIINPKTANDFLLKKRADIIADNPRYLRVYVNKRHSQNYNALEETFSDKHYKAFLNKLPEEEKKKCLDVAYGDIFYKDFNAYTESTDFGIIVYLNQSLDYFLFFFNLAILDFGKEVPLYVRFNALRISVRISMQNELMDFEIDPRGIIPTDIRRKIDELVFFEKQFIAGHEFSHYLCGHLKSKCIKRIYTIKNKFFNESVYNISQQHEFEADLSSITRPVYNDEEKGKIIHAAVVFFASLDFAEFVDNLLNPNIIGYKSHPSAMDRFNKIISVFSDDVLKYGYDIKGLIEITNYYKKLIKEDLDENLDIYDFYGSYYLDKPDTKWRGKELIDRVDY